MGREVRTALLSLRKKKVEFRDNHHQLLDRHQQVDQHAQVTKAYWGEQKYCNQSLYAEQHMEHIVTHQFADLIQSQREEQMRQDERLIKWKRKRCEISRKRNAPGTQRCVRECRTEARNPDRFRTDD